MFNDKSAYTLEIKVMDDGQHYFVSFLDGQNIHRKIEVSNTIFLELNESIKVSRNLTRFDERHIEKSEQKEETLYSRALHYQKGVEDIIIDMELSNSLRNAIANLPDIQRRRFILYYEFGFTYEKIAETEGCSIRAIKYSVDIAKEKIIKFFKK